MQTGLSNKSNIQKRVKNISEFKIQPTKKTGFQQGYVAERKKKTSNFSSYILKIIKFDYSSNSRDASSPNITEFLAAGFFSYLLGKECNIKLNNDSKPGYYFISSKVINNVEELRSFDKNKLNQVEGFEKLIAACWLLGEVDYRSSNFLVNRCGNQFKLIKIDHGYAFKFTKLNFKNFIIYHAMKFKEFTYDNCINQKLKFNINVLINELEEMLDKLNDKSLIDELFDSRLNLLTKTILHLEYYKNCFIEKKQALIKHIDFMRNTVLPNLKIIAKYSNMSDEFKNGLWFIELGKAESKDTILYAINNSIKIENTDPIDWAIKNNAKIDGVDALEYKAEEIAPLIETKEKDKIKANDSIGSETNLQTTENLPKPIIGSFSLNIDANNADSSRGITTNTVNSSSTSGNSNAVLTTLSVHPTNEHSYDNNKCILLTTSAVTLAAIAAVACVIYCWYRSNATKFAIKVISQENIGLAR